MADRRPEKEQEVFIKEMPAQKTNKTKKRSGQGRRPLFLLGLIVLFIGFFAFENIKNIRDARRLDQQLVQAEKQLQLDQDYQADLEEYIRLLQNEDYVLNIARNEYYLTEDGEIVFNFVGERDNLALDMNKKQQAIEKEVEDIEKNEDTSNH